MNPQEFVSIHTLLISPIPILLCLTTEDYTHTTLIITNVDTAKGRLNQVTVVATVVVCD
jgi:hypothetical protein